MAHREQEDFCLKVKSDYPEYFENKRVLDVGSLDINGSNRGLFTNCEYIGIDLGEGKNVDVICPAHEYCEPDDSFDTIVSTETFEHDKFLLKTLDNIMRLLKPCGLFFFTCATNGRPEHGTSRTIPADSPFTLDFYRPVSADLIKSSLDLSKFKTFRLSIEKHRHDLRFVGVKDGQKQAT